MLRKNTKLILFLLWMAFVIRATFYISIIPLWEGFDEHAHFGYVQHIAEHLALPLYGREFISKEVYSSLRMAPLPYEPKGFGLGLTHDEYWRLTEGERFKRQDQIKQIAFAWRQEPLRDSNGYTHVQIYEAQHGPLYYIVSVIPYKLFYARNIVDRAFAIRFFSVLISSILVFLSFFVAKLVFRDEALAIGITALIIFMPGLMIDICRVGNDSLAILLFSLLIAVCLKYSELTYQRSVIIGIILGAGLLTKAYFFTAIPSVLIMLFYNSFKTRSGKKKFIAHVIVIVLICGGISFWWYLRNYVMLGSFTALQQNVVLKNQTIFQTLKYIPNVDWQSAGASTFASHIWFGNWSFLTIRSWMYHTFLYLFVISFFGILLKAVTLIVKRKPPCDQFRHVRLLLNFYLWFLLGISYHVLITYAVYNVSASSGWYLYSLVIPEIVLLIYGLCNWVPTTWHPRILGLVIFLFSLLDLYGLSFIMIPYYTGFISHKPNGVLISFKPYHLSFSHFSEILTRLAINKLPFMTASYYIVVGIIFLLSSLVAIAVSLRFVYGYGKT